MTKSDSYENEFYKMVEETVVKLEKYLSENLPKKWLNIHDDIIWMNFYLLQPEKQSERSITDVIEMLARCRKILEYGDKIIFPKKPEYIGRIFLTN